MIMFAHLNNNSIQNKLDLLTGCLSCNANSMLETNIDKTFTERQI